ncbi:aminotransferase class V-fold PLP-dependent enzyme [Cloacibacillus sp. An23]|uniref:pyridoxal-phosphate-dependent aminotransferase family protein n=1 Tax=Cloacibacillus sp. An23 TaxID=1965591 RepID=UPI0013022FF7|nr:aminotransferase class V-fold PLP-dependent enzyme [Cloacibacillus sp. An23]
MRKYLLTPGPVEVPPPVLAAGAAQMESHRCAAFSSLFMGISEKLGRLFESSSPVVILPSSGTGALECAAVNFLGAGDKFVSLSCGAFGKRFREIAQRTGAEGVFADYPEGCAPAPGDAAELLRAHPDAKALLITHNETSTGVTVPVKDIIAALPKERRTLVLVDGVSSVGAMECFPEQWGIDVLCTASQKGLMTPPGLGFVWLSERALAELDSRRCPSYYFDLKLHLKYMKKDSYENPYTPPVSLYYALDAALGVILRDGARSWFAKRRRWAGGFASGLEGMGYELLVKDPALRSAGVTAFSAPGGKSEAVRAVLSRMGLTTAGGQGGLKGKLIRSAHYSDWGETELKEILGAFGEALKETAE